MFATINTDAGLCVKTDVGGFAFWISTNKAKIKMSGVFKGKMDNPTIAELRCIFNALHYVRKNMPEVSEILVNTDCDSAIKILTNEHLSKKAHIKSEQMYFKDFVQSNPGLKVIFKHVKGHSKNKDARSFVNQWADKAVRTELKNHRKQLSENGTSN